jgi:peptidoglycan hydrolase CwlO-like protein
MKNKTLLPYLILAVFIFSAFSFVFRIPATAQTETPTPTSGQSKNQAEILRQIDETQAKISALQGEEKTLSSQIGVIDNQIKLTQLKIDSARAQISDLTLDIDTADKKIGKLENSLDSLSEILINRIKETYIVGSTSKFQMLLTSSNVEDFVKKANYLRIAQAHDKRLIYDTVQARNDYSNQKDIFEDKKVKIEQLNAELVTYQAQLDTEKAGKEQLLAVTKNDEAKFQELLARLKADAASINIALGNINAKIGSVNKGDIIAGVGSSGCSTGPHLHLEVYVNASVQNNRVVGNRVDPKPYMENSSYQQPVPGYPGNVTTWYGEVYFLGTHTGLDLANPFGTPIRAMESGEAYATSATCSYNGSLGKGIIVDHKNGTVSLYWHIP